jgi:hypothetical protein
MFVEISLLQRFSLILGHPVYSLSVALFAKQFQDPIERVDWTCVSWKRSAQSR